MPDIIQHYYESDVYRRGSYSDLTHEIALVRKEIEAADNLFQNASDPDLIDSYIFQGNAARKRYSFLSIPFLQEVPGSCFVQSIDPVPDNLPAFSLLFLVSPFAPTP